MLKMVHQGALSLQKVQVKGQNAVWFTPDLTKLNLKSRTTNFCSDWQLFMCSCNTYTAGIRKTKAAHAVVKQFQTIS